MTRYRISYRKTRNPPLFIKLPGLLLSLWRDEWKLRIGFGRFALIHGDIGPFEFLLFPHRLNWKHRCR